MHSISCFYPEKECVCELFHSSVFSHIPYRMHTPEMNVPERLKAILDILTKFHTEIVVNTIESNTEPTSLNTLRKQLSLYGMILSQWIESDGEYIHPASDDTVKKYIDELKVYMYPSEQSVSTLTQYWIEQMFHESPFTLSIHHIERLKNSIDKVDE